MVNSLHKVPVTRKRFPFDDIIMNTNIFSVSVLMWCKQHIHTSWVSNDRCSNIKWIWLSIPGITKTSELNTHLQHNTRILDIRHSVWWTMWAPLTGIELTNYNAIVVACTDQNAQCILAIFFTPCQWSNPEQNVTKGETVTYFCIRWFSFPALLAGFYFFLYVIHQGNKLFGLRRGTSLTFQINFIKAL